ncbi:branched-chain amino acid ABC transporter permease [Nakamurella sp. YIM 132087]|uniref:Branched-chain amino acid ABC transporter permease n=1 Tax=Nakamurella alba TaxID=2665158 RepID=A0A7K1FF98_9ACTN|nr:branched-chain amino acid ABC transporter permease [Nakamurella alba]MTD12777.1 branched-chain amino acid ABC transporter permease [Nakamurella alba]
MTVTEHLGVATHTGSRRSRALRFVAVPAVLSVVVVVLSALLSTGPGSLVSTLSVALINLTMVVGLYIFVGNSGIHSFGHLSFASVGGFTAAILVMPLDLKTRMFPDAPALTWFALDPFPAVLVGGLVAAVFGFLVVLPLSRINGLSAGLATVSILIAVNVIASNWDSVTRGRRGISSIPSSTTVTTAVLWAIAAIWAAWLFQRSPFGKRLRASKSDEVAAQAAGVSIARERIIAFTLSAFFTGIGGGLFALLLGSVTPGTFYLDYTFVIIAMLVIGGTDSLTGAVTGAVVVSVLSEVLRKAEAGDVLGLFEITPRPGLQYVVLGIIMVLILLLRPAGLTRGRELTEWFTRRRRKIPPTGGSPIAAGPTDPPGPVPPANPGTTDTSLVKESR